MLIKLIQFILRLLALLCLLSLEHAIGLPWFFIFCALLWIKTQEEKNTWLLSFFLSFFLAVVYGIYFSFVFLIFILLNFILQNKNLFMRRSIWKILFIAVIINFMISFLSPGFSWNIWVFIQMMLSLGTLIIGVYILRSRKRKFRV